MIDLEMATTYGVEHPDIFQDAFGEQHNLSLVTAARLATLHTDRYIPIYEEKTDESKNAGNCADRFSRIHSLMSAFPSFYPVLATFENQEYGSFHFFNVVVDLESVDLDTLVIDNSYLRNREQSQKLGTHELVTTPWAAKKRDQLIYGPIYSSAKASAARLAKDPTLTELEEVLGHLRVPIMQPGTDFYTATDEHVPQLMIPDDDEALESGIEILKPTIVRVYNNDESCRIADEIAYSRLAA